MIRFIKSQASAGAATSIDFLVTFMLMQVAELGLPLSNVLGNVAGAMTNFSVSSRWVFSDQIHSLNQQILKYVLVWCGYLLLNAMLVSWITSWLDTYYLLIKM